MIDFAPAPEEVEKAKKLFMDECRFAQIVSVCSDRQGILIGGCVIELITPRSMYGKQVGEEVFVDAIVSALRQGGQALYAQTIVREGQNLTSIDQGQQGFMT